MKRFNICLLLSFLWLLLVTVLSGCGIFRNAKSDKISTKRDSTITVDIRDKSKEKTIDKTVIRTTTTADSSVTIPGFTAVVSTPVNLDALKDGLVVFQDDRIEVWQALNNQSQVLQTNIRVKNRHASVPFTTRTEELRDVITEKHANIRLENKTRVKEKHMDEHTTTTPNYNWIWYVAGLAAFVALAYYLYKKFF